VLTRVAGIEWRGLRIGGTPTRNNSGLVASRAERGKGAREETEGYL
jgi:hypothetical protein